MANKNNATPALSIHTVSFVTGFEKNGKMIAIHEGYLRGNDKRVFKVRVASHDKNMFCFTDDYEMALAFAEGMAR